MMLRDLSRDLFSEHGALHVPELLAKAEAAALAAKLAPLPLHRPGLRLNNAQGLRDLLSGDGAMGRLAASLIGAQAMPVRALLFDKSVERNWGVGWHQDRVIAVAERRDVAGFGPWSVKDGILHVAPPVAVLRDMVTIRLHLDPVCCDNAPLLYAAGSHRLGMVPDDEVADAVRRCGTGQSLAAAGDAWVYASLILHASKPATRLGRRRVLHVDYAARPLPDGLEWLGI